MKPIALLTVLGLSEIAAQARPSEVIQIRPLVDESTIVLVGEVIRIDRTGTQSLSENGKDWLLSSMTADVRPVETVKGDAVPQMLEIPFLANDDQRGSGPQTATTDIGHQMLFLKRDNETYRFADAIFGSVPVIRQCTPNSPEASNAYGKAIGRIGCAFSSANATAQDRADALMSLRFENSPTAREIFIEALKSNAARFDSDFRRHLIASLLGRDYEPAIDMAERELFVEPPGSSTNGRLDILFGLQSVSAQSSVPLLRSLNDPDPEVQFYVMQSLGYLNHEHYWRPQSTGKDAFWYECLNHWQALARQRAGN